MSYDISTKSVDAAFEVENASAKTSKTDDFVETQKKPPPATIKDNIKIEINIENDIN